MINSKFTFEKKRIINRWLKKKPPFSPPEPGPMSARGLQHRTGYERDEPRFELIFRKSKTRSSTRSVVRVPGYPRLAIVSVSIRSTKSGGRGAIEKAVRTSMAAARDSGSTRGNPLVRRGDRIDRQRRAAVDKQPRIPILTPPLFTPNWNSIFGGRAGGLAPKELKPVTLWWIIFKGKI